MSMSNRPAVILVILGALLLIGGSVLAVAFHDYRIFSMTIIPREDVAACIGLALLGLVLLVFGTRALLRARRMKGPA
ncbi:hypothetical protein ACFL3Z_01690 [Gemmatimonadota bacterium]